MLHRDLDLEPLEEDEKTYENNSLVSFLTEATNNYIKRPWMLLKDFQLTWDLEEQDKSYRIKHRVLLHI